MDKGSDLVNLILLSKEELQMHGSLTMMIFLFYFGQGDEER